MKFGVKARWTDARVMAKLGTGMIEVFVGERDLFENYENMKRTFHEIADEYSLEYVIHNQEYWVDGNEYRLVDLASRDEGQRKNAKKIVGRTLDLADDISARYVIVHPGGISPDAAFKEEHLSLLIKSLSEVQNERLLVENMPWFYIMRGGEIWRSSICIEPEDFSSFSEFVGGTTLDICHAFLSTRKGGNHYITQMMKSLGRQIKHVHASDARPPHEEGLQIGTGSVDFDLLKNINVGIVPEIIGGHENDGEGFAIAIKRLQKYATSAL